MSRTGWKSVERAAAACVGAQRFWANAGSRCDVDSPHFAVQVKNPQRLSLNDLTMLVEEMTLIGIDQGKIPVVFVKQSTRRPTPLLAVVPAEVLAKIWELRGPSGEDAQRVISAALRQTPGMRARVAAFVEKSMMRGRRSAVQEARGGARCR